MRYRLLPLMLGLSLAFFTAAACSDDEGGDGNGTAGSAQGGSSASAGTSSGGGTAADSSVGASGGASGWGPTDGGCFQAPCSGHIYQCGNCMDDDKDGLIDSEDPDCLGPCDNTETGYYPDLPGTTGGPCKADCFWDNGNGSGNDDCYWDHRCDKLEVAPDYPPEGPDCAYDDKSSPGGGLTCATAQEKQSQTCYDYCGPLVPNGCDCFGCCILPGAPTPIWMGSVVYGTNSGTCFPDSVGDPTKCRPCTMLPGCKNDCEECEICIGKPEPGPNCDGGTQCPAGVQPCGLEGQDPCQQGFYCITGCCIPVPA